MSLEFLPKPLRQSALMALAAAGLIWLGVQGVAWLESKADARVSVRLDPVVSCVEEMKSDVKAIRADVAQTALDVAVLKARAEGKP